jgi:hypothetical protein
VALTERLGQIAQNPARPPSSDPPTAIRPNAAYQPRRALRAVGWMRLFGGS